MRAEGVYRQAHFVRKRISEKELNKMTVELLNKQKRLLEEKRKREEQEARKNDEEPPTP